jgi:DNA polymerase III subunit epsilon
VNLWSLLRRSARPDDLRWVVVDVETTGLDPRRDQLLAIAGVAIDLRSGRPLIALGDSFEIVLRRSSPAIDKSNILLHGIGVGAQRTGVEPAIALQCFVDWVATSPLIAFHSAFDEAVILRALRLAGNARLRNPWVDLAHVAEVAQPQVLARSLDEWLAHHGIACAVRHQAAADTLATAELLLKLWPAVVAAGGDGGFSGLRELAAQRRWLKPGG